MACTLYANTMNTEYENKPPISNLFNALKDMINPQVYTRNFLDWLWAMDLPLESRAVCPPGVVPRAISRY